MRSRDGKSQREEKSRREKIREEKESEKTLCFSNDLWLRRVEK
jgi:hypothetical protein